MKWRPQRDLNPCYRLERAVSWARLDDGDAGGRRRGQTSMRARDLSRRVARLSRKADRWTMARDHSVSIRCATTTRSSSAIAWIWSGAGPSQTKLNWTLGVDNGTTACLVRRGESAQPSAPATDRTASAK